MSALNLMTLTPFTIQLDKKEIRDGNELIVKPNHQLAAIDIGEGNVHPLRHKWSDCSIRSHWG